MQSDVAESAEVQPIPPRFRWLKRFLKAGAVLIIGLVCLRIWWGYEADRRLQAEIESYRAAGQLVYASEFDALVENVPDDDNAALLYEQAMEKIVSFASNGTHFSAFTDDPALFDSDMSTATELLQKNAEALQLVQRAREHSQVAWTRRLQDIVSSSNFVSLSANRELSRLLLFSAEFHFRTGDHAKAIASVHDLLDFSTAVHSPPLLINSLVAMACYNLGISFVSENGADLEIDHGSLSTDGDARPANRRSITKLIRKLINEEEVRETLIRMYLGDRTYALESPIDAGLDWMFFGANTGTPPAWYRVLVKTMEPALTLETLRSLKASTIASEAAVEPSWSQAKEHFPDVSQSRSLLARLSRPVMNGIYGDFSSTLKRTLEIHFQHIAHRRMAAIALGIRLYEVDHGHRPSDLIQLVPDYLSSIPLDPFADDGSTIRYKPDEIGQILFSVWSDGKENSGVSAQREGGGYDKDRSDLPFYLDGRPKKNAATKQAPSGKAGDDDKDIENDNGQDKKEESDKS